MTTKKSDFKKFCETMWIMAKYDVLPWVIGAGIVALVTVGVQKANTKSKIQQQTTFQNQR